MSQLDRVWRQSRLSTTTKFHIYNSCVLSSLLYASDTWTLLKPDIAKLETFHMMNQRRIFGIFWYELVTNVEIATLLQLPSINEATHIYLQHTANSKQDCRPMTYGFNPFIHSCTDTYIFCINLSILVVKLFLSVCLCLLRNLEILLISTSLVTTNFCTTAPQQLKK